MLNDRSRFAVGRVTALLGMNGFEHVAHLADPGCRHMAEDIPVKMNHSAASRSRQMLSTVVRCGDKAGGKNFLKIMFAGAS
jgi:hypothetical protein